MGELKPPVENARLAENDVFHALLVLLIDVFRAIEPHQIHYAATVGKMRHDALFPCAHRKLLERQDFSLQLHKRHIGLQFVDAVNAAAIDIFIRIMLQQFTPRRNAEFLVQKFGAPWSHTRQIFDILVEKVHSFIICWEEWV